MKLSGHIMMHVGQKIFNSALISSIAKESSNNRCVRKLPFCKNDEALTLRKL